MQKHTQNIHTNHTTPTDTAIDAIDFSLTWVPNSSHHFSSSPLVAHQRPMPKNPGWEMGNQREIFENLRPFLFEILESTLNVTKNNPQKT